jgi:DNA-binding NarL/FixJ family response regulator
LPNTILSDRAVLRILLADDHSFIREGLKGLIAKQHDMEVVGEAEDGELAVWHAGDCSPDVVVMDISMPRMNGVLATKEIKRVCPHTQVLALSMHEDVTYLRALIEAGASGYILKRSAPQELIRAIRHVAAGETYLDPAVAGRVTSIFVGKSMLRGEVVGTPLSEREESVIKLVARGHTNREVAERLELSVKTTETYRSRAMEKLGFSSRADLVRHASVRGWLDDD